MMKNIDERIEIIPAHIWTSHFSLMGEYNQLTKVEDCFKDNTKYIFSDAFFLGIKFAILF